MGVLRSSRSRPGKTSSLGWRRATRARSNRCTFRRHGRCSDSPCGGLGASRMRATWSRRCSSASPSGTGALPGSEIRNRGCSGVAHHVAIDVTRRRKRRTAEPLDEVQLLTAPQSDGVRAIDAARASKLLGQLPPAQRDAIYLRHFADCTFAAIGTDHWRADVHRGQQVPPGDRAAPPPHGGDAMNEEPGSVERLLAGLGPPEQPRGLQERTLRGAREALAREAGRDLWTRIWESRPLRLAWAATVAVLVICHIGMTERRLGRTPTAGQTTRAAREGNGERGGDRTAAPAGRGCAAADRHRSVPRSRGAGR